jgi:hypothetical protein
MTTSGTMIRTLVAAMAAASLGSCGGGGDGDGGGGGTTSLRGSIVVPDASQCENCTNRNVTVRVFGLPANLANPSTAIATTTTDANGNYDTGDLTIPLAQFDPESDTKSFVVVAAVSTNASIGGVESQRLGATQSKDFNTTTQIAGAAAVLLTNTIPDCTVPETRIDPASSLDDGRINNLEQAASVVAGRINLANANDVKCAACTTIACSDQGDQQINDTVRSCVSSTYETCRPAGS